MNISKFKDAMESLAETIGDIVSDAFETLKDLLLSLRGGVVEERPLGESVQWYIEDVNPRGIVLRSGVHRERYSREELWTLLTEGVMRFGWKTEGG